MSEKFINGWTFEIATALRASQWHNMMGFWFCHREERSDVAISFITFYRRSDILWAQRVFHFERFPGARMKDSMEQKASVESGLCAISIQGSLSFCS